MTTTRIRRSVLCVALAAAGLAPAFAVTNPLVMDAVSVKAAGIVVDKVTTRTLSDEIRAPGEVKANAYATVLVTPRIEAQVLSRQAKLGDIVKAGQALVKLSSVEVAGTQGELIVAEQDWQRVASLGPQAVSARRYYEAKVHRDQARAKLRAYGLSDGQISRLLKSGSAQADGSFELLAPTDGRISSDDFLTGQRVEPGRTLFTIVKEDSVWVQAQVPPGDAERIKIGGVVRVLVHGTEVPGKVIQLSHQIDERTRTVPVRIVVENTRDLLHPGELVDARLTVGQSGTTVAVPAESVVILQNQPTVFIVKGKDQFEAAPVIVGATRDGWTEVKEGLTVGTAYVRKGAFSLKARLLRSQLGEE
jgi:cobalt-zinc-cadmium efflux system membrane fusion protein